MKMNREIKFRTWYNNEYLKGGGYMHEFNLGQNYFKFSAIDIETNESVDWTFELSDVENIMQFTGLKDKNGVDIYEGDVIKNGYGEGVIIYETYCCAFKIQWIKTVFDNDKSWFPVKGQKHIEVIGNIYENPELL